MSLLIHFRRHESVRGKCQRETKKSCLSVGSKNNNIVITFSVERIKWMVGIVT